MKTSTSWTSAHAFTSEVEGNSFTIDADRKQGPNPKALLLSGLAACSGVDVVDILDKMRVPMEALDITAEADQSEEHPRVFLDITVTYKVKTAAENRDKVAKAIELSLEKYCGVAAMLRKNSAINYTLEIV